MADKSTVDFLEEQAGAGLENVDIQDMSLPFLRVAQSLSPQLDKDSDAYMEGLELGMFFNTVTKFIYGKEVGLIPIRYERAWIEWHPDRGGYVGKHSPGSIKIDKSEFSKWKYNGNVISDTMMFYCLISGHLDHGPILFCLSSTGIKHAKNWLTQINMTKLPSKKTAPIFSSVWKLFTAKQVGKKGAYYQLGDKSSNVSRERFITPDEYSKFVGPMVVAIQDMKADMKQLEDNTGYSNVEEPVQEANGTKVGY